jgi:hypothetical protein
MAALHNNGELLPLRMIGQSFDFQNQHQLT